MILEEYLNKHRHNPNMTHKCVAKKAGITVCHFSRIVNGRSMPSIYVAKKIETFTKGEIKWHELMDFCYKYMEQEEQAKIAQKEIQA